MPITLPNLTLAETILRFRQDAELVHLFVKGDPTVDVPGEDGTYPSLAKLLAEVRDRIAVLEAKVGMPVHARLPVLEDGQSVFTLTHLPRNPLEVILTVNGVQYRWDEADGDFLLDATTLTWNNPAFTLEVNDNVLVSYSY